MDEPRDPRINARPLNDTIAGTGPGIPDDALAPGEELQNPPDDAEVGRAARKLGAPVPEADGGAARGES
jgi:hypothetical protein